MKNKVFFWCRDFLSIFSSRVSMYVLCSKLGFLSGVSQQLRGAQTNSGHQENLPAGYNGSKRSLFRSQRQSVSIKIVHCTGEDLKRWRIVYDRETDEQAIIVIANHLDNDSEKQGALENLLALLKNAKERSSSSRIKLSSREESLPMNRLNNLSGSSHPEVRKASKELLSLLRNCKGQIIIIKDKVVKPGMRLTDEQTEQLVSIWRSVLVWYRFCKRIAPRVSI